MLKYHCLVYKIMLFNKKSTCLLKSMTNITFTLNYKKKFNWCILAYITVEIIEKFTWFVVLGIEI
jgi:hypothetical protein